MSDFKNREDTGMSARLDKNPAFGFSKPYLSFLDGNVLFKKPVSCLIAIVSLLWPFLFLVLFIQGIRGMDLGANFVVAGILVFIVALFAGVFGALIWWHRRIANDEGPKFYDNLRRFIQTMGEFLGTTFAIVTFGSMLILGLILGQEVGNLIFFMPLVGDILGVGDIVHLGVAGAFVGPVVGFVIIICTKILLFLLDPIIWLLKQIWRYIRWFFRCLINLGTVVEKHTPVWFGVAWLLGVAVVIAGLVLCFQWYAVGALGAVMDILGGGMGMDAQPSAAAGIFSALVVAFGLGFLAFLVHKKKNFVIGKDDTDNRD